MLNIPLNGIYQNGEEQRFLQISKANLPEDIDQLTSLLNKERVPINYWL